MEMTGLDPERERVLEIAVVVTDKDLAVLAESPPLILHQEDRLLDAMDDWNTHQHGRSGLVEEVRNSRLSETEAEARLIEFLADYAQPGKSPLCGNSVHQDRRFMRRYLPKLEEFFHYRNLDVSTLKELARRWHPELLRKQGQGGVIAHRALSDILRSIEELRWFRQQFFSA